MSGSKLRALDELGPRWMLPAATADFDLTEAFGRSAPCLFDVGFGDGAATAAYAAAHPDHDVLAVDVHPTGIAHLLRAIDTAGLTNIRIVDGDAHDVAGHLPSASLRAVHVYFPDPWPKRRHHPRRLLQAAFVGRLGTALETGGRLEIATDWSDYAAAIRDTVLADGRFLVMEGGRHGFSPRPAERPATNYERRGLAAGRSIYDLVAERR
jgi:tRNA (guanine-N7-)-methyltransferase